MYIVPGDSVFSAVCEDLVAVFGMSPTAASDGGF